MSSLAVAMILMGSLALILGAAIGIFVKFFKVESDPRIDLVLELLPGANCGGCGCAGCADFAKAVVSGALPPSRCPVSSQEQVNSIAYALGVEVSAGGKMQAVVCCGGDQERSKVQLNYNGITDCAAANMVAGGPKGCRFGCLGMGTCARTCPFGAIEIINGLAVVHPEICVGCGKCVAVCPRGVIKLVPETANFHVYCNSPEKGAAKRSLCQSSCIGCRKCERTVPEKFEVNGFLAKVKYDAEPLTSGELEAIKCPTGAFDNEQHHYDVEKEKRGAK